MLSAEAVADLIRLWAQGLTMTEIGQKLKTNRNVIAGQIYRLRRCGTVILRRTKLPSGDERKKCKAAARLKRWRAARRPRNNVVKLQKKPTPPPTPPPATDAVTTILARRPNQCAYPIGHRIFCGAPVCEIIDKRGEVKQTSWCEFHWNLCHRKEA